MTTGATFGQFIVTRSSTPTPAPMSKQKNPKNVEK